jgi:hypothetical protein
MRIFSLLLGPVFHAITAAVAVSVKISVHAGPNNQSGGCQAGLRKFRYQSSSVVNAAPSPATATVAMVAVIIGNQSPT